jgi:hypothetical protein
MRPEDVQLGPEVQRFAARIGIELSDVRHARATAGQAMWVDDQPIDGEWLVFFGETVEGRKLRMVCGPRLDLVATFRPVE